MPSWNSAGRGLDLSKKAGFVVSRGWEAENHQDTEETSLGRER